MVGLLVSMYIRRGVGEGLCEEGNIEVIDGAFD